MVMITLYARQQKRYRCIRLLDSEGEGKGGMIWENGTETCILSCKKRIASLCLIQDAWGWCTGKIQRDDMGCEGGSGLGTHVHP